MGDLVLILPDWDPDTKVLHRELLVHLLPLLLEIIIKLAALEIKEKLQGQE